QDAVQRPLLRWFAALGPDPQAVEAPRRRPSEQRAREPVERAAPAGCVVVAGEEADPAAVGDVAPVPAPRADGGEPVRGGEPQGRRARAVGPARLPDAHTLARDGAERDAAGVPEPGGPARGEP